MKHNINKKNRNTFKNIMDLEENDLELLSLIMSNRNIFDIQKAYRHRPCDPCYDDRKYTSISRRPIRIINSTNKKYFYRHKFPYVSTGER